jgi:hypothetical protein
LFHFGTDRNVRRDSRTIATRLAMPNSLQLGVWNLASFKQHSRSAGVSGSGPRDQGLWQGVLPQPGILDFAARFQRANLLHECQDE